MRFLLYIPFLLISLSSCDKKNIEQEVNYETENVIIIFVDGPRYTETWGFPAQAYIPFQTSLKSKGVFYHNFYNEGVTSTTPGHTAVMTGTYQNINNNGAELPFLPSIFQRWRKESGKSQQAAWIITSKDKLEVLGNCSKLDWQNMYLPSTLCGISGIGSGYRHDSVTLNTALSVMDYHHPNMVMINFREPDFSGHTGDWNDYINGIQMTDEYIEEIWNYIDTDPNYKGKTTLFITNDHGRHQEGVQSGFVGHGDDCNGCKHISLLAIGPDFNAGVDVIDYHEMRDIPLTIAQMMNFPLSNPEGRILTNIFKE